MTGLPAPRWRGEMHWCELPGRPESHFLRCQQCGTRWIYSYRSWVQSYLHEGGRSWLQPLGNAVVVYGKRTPRHRTKIESRTVNR